MSRKQFSGISELWKASIHRLEDARCLFEKERWRGAMYMAGYAVECRFKCQLMRKWKCRNLPELEEALSSRKIPLDAYTHNLERLLECVGTQGRMKQNLRVWKAFSRVNRWQPAWRYDPNLASQSLAEDFLDAVKSVVQWIDHNT